MTTDNTESHLNLPERIHDVLPSGVIFFDSKPLIEKDAWVRNWMNIDIEYEASNKEEATTEQVDNPLFSPDYIEFVHARCEAMGTTFGKLYKSMEAKNKEVKDGE
jgi:hypothetical protein